MLPHRRGLLLNTDTGQTPEAVGPLYLYEHLPIYKITACPDCSILVVANLARAYDSRNTGRPQFKPVASLWLERDRNVPNL